MIQTLRHYAGLLLIILGTLALILTRIETLAGSNSLLITGLLLIVVGIWLHIRSIKQESAI
jgi:uncharacterized membrane protein HdeD (DUF308 family)